VEDGDLKITSNWSGKIQWMTPGNPLFLFHSLLLPHHSPFLSLSLNLPSRIKSGLERKRP
jgi:hypothetical protein